MPLDHTAPSPLAGFPPAPPSSGDRRTGAAAVAVIALIVGLLAGFAGGFFFSQSREPIAAPREVAEATYTDTAIEPDPIPEAAPQDAAPPVTSEVMRGAPLRGAEPAAERPVPATSVSGSLLVASRPAGARVIVDGRRVGVTPLSVPGVKAGSHRVRLELPGFRPWATSVDVDNGARTRVGASLEQ